MLGSAAAYTQKPQRQGDTYEQPTPQIVLIRGDQCFEPISLPSMQQYYTNVNMLNTDYAFLKVTYFDFPMADSLTKHAGAQVSIRITVKVSSTTIPFRYREDTHYNDLQHATNVSVIDIDTAGISSIEHFVQRVKAQLFNVLTEGHKMNTENLFKPAMRLLGNWFADFIYDQASQKIALVFQAPSSYINSNTVTSDLAYIRNISVRFEGDHTGGAGKLLASLFGGVYSQTGWSSEFDSNYSDWFYTQTVSTQGDAVASKIFNTPTFLVTCKHIPKVFMDPFVYIRGSPESSIWNTDGTTSDVLAVQPRNRPAGFQAAQTAFLTDQTHASKASLNSIRNMMLRFTDKDGNLLRIDEEYVVKLGIAFNV